MSEAEISIDVTADDIKYGKARVCDYCPIAHAALRVFKDTPLFESLAVGSDVISVIYHGVTKHYLLPLLASKFIAEFDAGCKVEPFAFKVRDGHTFKFRWGDKGN